MNYQPIYAQPLEATHDMLKHTLRRHFPHLEEQEGVNYDEMLAPDLARLLSRHLNHIFPENLNPAQFKETTREEAPIPTPTPPLANDRGNYICKVCKNKKGGNGGGMLVYA